MYLTSRFSGLKPPLRGGSPLHELTVRAWICRRVLLQLGSTTSRIWLVSRESAEMAHSGSILVSLHIAISGKLKKASWKSKHLLTPCLHHSCQCAITPKK